jgi:hypothetical protein
LFGSTVWLLLPCNEEMFKCYPWSICFAMTSKINVSNPQVTQDEGGYPWQLKYVHYIYIIFCLGGLIVTKTYLHFWGHHNIPNFGIPSDLYREKKNLQFSPFASMYLYYNYVHCKKNLHVFILTTRWTFLEITKL